MYSKPMTKQWIAAVLALVLAPVCAHAQDKGRVVEEIIARVNNDIITLTDFHKAETSLRQEVAQDCQNCPQEKIDAEFKDRQKDLLRDLIDQSLLVQRAKDSNISVETDLIKRLDQVRIQNNLTSLEDLEKAVEGQGIPWEDYKSNLRNTMLTQEVIRREVGSRVVMGSDEVKKYYEDHKAEFVRPEQVLLGEIFLSTEGKTPAEITDIEKKANDLLDRVKKGEDFSELARRFSEGSTAKQGGELGTFERGQLSKELEDIVFKMNKGDMTGVTRTKTGFQILRVFDHFQAGQQPLDKVEGEISNRLFSEKMQPTLRTYLAELREQSYVTVKPGFVDSAAVPTSAIEEVAPTADQPTKKGKKGKKASL
jgi:peptidyl-prolyl cis-trans isomerase SurA